MSPKTKVIVARSILAAVYLTLLVVMFYTGRTHTILVDNKDIEGISAIRSMTVTVGKEPAADFRRGERDKFTVKGQKLHITITPTGAAPQTFAIPIPLGEDSMLLSVPKLLAGATAYITPFDLYAQTPPAAQEEKE